MPNGTTNSILAPDVIKRKMRRMAFEIAERNADADGLIIAGISGNGVIVAQNIVQELQQIVSYPIQQMIININKKNPLEVNIDAAINFDNKIIIVVDDVANSGRTLLYAVKSFLDFTPQSIQILVLVERSHKLFPVQTDYVGLSIATTLQEQILVHASGNDITGAYLQ